MQGQRSSVTTLPENLSFDHGSTSSDGGIDSQVPWTTIQASAENGLPDYRISPSETNSPYAGHDRLNGEWSLGESSSRNQADCSERKIEYPQSVHSLPVLEHQPQPSNILSLNTLDVDGHGNHIANRSSILQISGSDALSQDLNMCLEFRDTVDDECQVVENPNAHTSVGSSNEKMPFTGIENSDRRPGCSLDGRRISCKRKAREVHVGQSSGAGSSNCFELAERSQWHAQNNMSNISMSTQSEHNLDFNNRSEQSNSGIRLGIGGTVAPNPFSSSVRGPAETSGRNFRLRINASHQQDHVSDIPVSTESNVGNSDVSSSRHSSRLLLRNRLFDLNPTTPSESGTNVSQTVLSHVPSLRRNPQSRWRGTSSSRTTNASASVISLEREGDAMLYEEFTPGSIHRSISEHPMFVPASEIGSSSQQPTNWNSASGNVASTSRVGSISGVNPSSPAWAHRSYPQYPRRLSEIVRRSLLSSVGTDSGGQSSNLAIRSTSMGAPQEMALPTSSGSGNHVHHIPNLRSALLERHHDAALGVPHPLRSLAAAGEGRSSIMSEQIRHVLDLMRRGEGLRIEDMMILDHSVLFGMADVFDRHRDMRMDVDNMSYEELLDLEERIGNVCTGLNEETIISRLKERKYPKRSGKTEAETEPCSICREEYNNGEDLGILECGHDFHKDCIKQWLLHKNLCPICKTTGLSK